MKMHVSNDFVDFIIDISQATGAILDMAHAYITILQNLSRNPSIIWLSDPSVQAVYEVIISFTGYITLYGDDTEAVRDPQKRYRCTERASIRSKKTWPPTMTLLIRAILK